MLSQARLRSLGACGPAVDANERSYPSASAAHAKVGRMSTNLPMEVLRSLVAIVDAGSMVRATERVFLTQSALSLQIKRLEEMVQAPVFHRDGKRLALTPAGESLVAYARGILELNDRAVAGLTGDALIGSVRVGLVQDFTEVMLSGVLSHFSRRNPEAQLQIRVGSSADLRDQLASDRLDIVVCMGLPDDPNAVKPTNMAWLGDFNCIAQERLPIAILDRPCLFREAALRALEAAGQPYQVVLETESLAALRAAVEAGIGITCRTTAFLGQGFEPLPLRHLPLPTAAYVLSSSPSPHPVIARLADLLRDALMER